MSTTDESFSLSWTDLVNLYGLTPGSTNTVTLTVTDNEGATDTHTGVLIVLAPYRLIVKLDQPGAGGDRDYIEGVDVGHAFITLVKSDGTEDSFGFYPTDSPVTPGPGVINNDAGHPFEKSKSFDISECEYNYLMNIISADQSSPPGYHFLAFNCVDWVLSKTSAIGINIPTVNRMMSITFNVLGFPVTLSGVGHNTGDFGEDL